jgi:hypothetical protein
MQSLSSHGLLPANQVPVAVRPEINQLLQSILRSTPFRTSRQCQDLFRYIVEHSLAGADDSLRERMIGIEVFGRRADYDTAEDPVVRLRAGDVRKRLAQYYQAIESEATDWKIEIPTGSYKAHFQRFHHSLPQPLPQLLAPLEGVLPAGSEQAGASPAAMLLPHRRDLKRKPFWALLVLGCLGAASAGVLLMRTAPAADRVFDVFWKPLLENSSPVLICTGSNPVYLLSPQARSRYKQTRSLSRDESPNLEPLVPLEELQNFSGADFLPVKDTYLTVGDASATAQIVSLMTSRRHVFDLRYGSDLSFGDLRQGSAILIGAFNNRWTLDMTDSLQFAFDSGDTPLMHVQDRADSSKSWWPKTSAGHVVEDYAIISRVLDSKTRGVLLTIAGLSHPGTQAAAEFVTNPRLIAKTMNQAPHDWKSKNLQLVLHTNVVNDIPGLPTVVAARYW